MKYSEAALSAEAKADIVVQKIYNICKNYSFNSLVSDEDYIIYIVFICYDLFMSIKL